MHLTGIPLNSSQELSNERTAGPEGVFTVCTQCKRVLPPRRAHSVPNIRMSREDDDRWVNFEDISKSQAVPLVNLSHGLCASCFQRMDAILVDSVSSSPFPLPLSFTRKGTITKSASSPLLSAHNTESSSPTRRPLHVLVVDDNKLQRQIHKRMVEQAGFKCDIAADGTQALEMAAANSYSLVLMDLMMGGTDGWSTSRRMRRQLLGASGGVGVDNLPRIVAVTGMHIDSKLIRECADAGMDDIIHKPVAPAVLNKLLSNHAAEVKA